MPDRASAASAPLRSAKAGPISLTVQGLNGWYGESHVLQGMDFNVQQGEVVTFLGRNGAGKTTTMKAIMGLLKRREGSIVINGTETIGVPTRAIAHLGIGYVPEERGIYGTLNVAENLDLPPRVAQGGWDHARIFDLFPNLQRRLRARGTALSGGEQQMLALARMLRTGAKLLLLDEPTEGLAPVIIHQMAVALNRLKREGFTILLVEQNLRFARGLADRHYVIEQGRVVDMVPESAFDATFPKIKSYLGV